MKDTLCSNDDASKLQHEGNYYPWTKEKEAKILAKKPMSSKRKIAKMDHGPKAMDVANSLSEPENGTLSIPEDTFWPQNESIK